MPNDTGLQLGNLPEPNQSSEVRKVGNTFTVAESPNANDKGILPWIYYNINYYTIHLVTLLVCLFMILRFFFTFMFSRYSPLSSPLFSNSVSRLYLFLIASSPQSHPLLPVEW